ncbi:MAG TPA: hypothetical protein DEH25_04615 [Chloroflexi bacterium]|nr:hypothetical protein [Chloroflexota bacterium]HBY08197.1 hypothetical protein [Chloroflexota bacterium]
MNDSIPSADLQRIIESAQRLGVGLDETAALQWLTAITQEQPGEEIVFDEREGVFGHRISMLDFSPEDLAHFRKLGRLVEFFDVPGKVETALALSGSAAQSKIQTFPGDADFFERVNIIADSQDEACQILADLMWQKAIDTFKGPTYQLLEVKLGNYPQDMFVDGKLHKAGTPIAWTAEQVRAKEKEGYSPDGTPATLVWEDIACSPGWCKLDWVVSDPQRGQLVNCSNMLDVTWEAPDGSITPLDGYLDPYFQEIYLDAESVPIFNKLAQHVSANALDEYVEALEREVNKYLTKDINYGKAAKRMYNVFRLTGRYEEAAYLRELFDEPTSMLYQVWALIRTMEECSLPGTDIPIENVQAQADKLIIAVVEALEGEQESTVVSYLLRLRDKLEDQKAGEPLTAEVEAARAEVINIVNNFFFEKLTGYPAIKLYIDEIQK